MATCAHEWVELHASVTCRRCYEVAPSKVSMLATIARLESERDGAISDCREVGRILGAHADEAPVDAATRVVAELAEERAANGVERGEWSKAMWMMVDNGTYSVTHIVPAVLGLQTIALAKSQVAEEAQALAESRGRRVEELENAAVSLIVAIRKDGASEIDEDTAIAMWDLDDCTAKSARYLSTAAPSTETEPK